MATMDIIKLHGGEPANFLDVGGGAQRGSGHRGLPHHPERREGAGRAGQHLRRHHAVRQDRPGHRQRRQGRSASSVPLVVRLEGTNVDAGTGRSSRQAKSEIPTMQTADDLDDAAKKVCDAVNVPA
jgi:succinyl-CoA synthetase beta subunit